MAPPFCETLANLDRPRHHNESNWWFSQARIRRHAGLPSPRSSLGLMLLTAGILVHGLAGRQTSAISASGSGEGGWLVLSPKLVPNPCHGTCCTDASMVTAAQAHG